MDAMHEPGHIENGVMFGRDGYLFLLDGGHHVFDLLLGLHKVSDQSFSNFGNNIAQRASICERAGVKFLHVIYPDKQSVMVDEFPVENPFCLTDIYLDKLPEVRKWVFYLRAALRNASLPPFMRTDTHLTEAGNIIAAGAIVEQLIGRDQSEHVNRLLASPDWHEIDYAGDLGGRFQPRLSEKRRLMRKTWPHRWFHNDLQGGNNGIVDILFSPGAVHDQRILIYGDSFSRDLSSVLSYFFREVVFLRTQYFHQDMFHQIQPDLLITSNVERYLSFCESDDRRASFFMFPHLGGNPYAPSKEFAEAFSAVLAYGRSPYFDFLNKHGLMPRQNAA